MIKTRLLGVMCTFLFALYLPITSYAALVLNPGPQLGGEVAVFGGGVGTTELEIRFDTMHPITIEFDNFGFELDELIIHRINNNTNTPWAGIEFSLMLATFDSPFPLMPMTSIVTDEQYEPESVFIPGVTNIITYTFDPFNPETAGIDFTRVLLNTRESSFYTLTITPSAVPIPSAVWLFGSGLIGLIGIARRKA